MKKVYLLFLFVPYSPILFGQKIDTLTNDKIINMVKNKVSDLLIKKSISTTAYWNFDLSSEALISLKNNKVSDSVILTMFEKESSIPNLSANSSKIKNDASDISQS